MKDENKCEAPLGGWFGECEKTDKNGDLIGYGIGKTIGTVYYYNKSQGMDNIHSYDCCKDCINEYIFKADLADEDYEDNVVIKIEYFDKNRKTQWFNQKIIIEGEN